MKGLRGLFRLGTLALLALTLMVAMALPSAAADECSSSQMLDEVEIVSVMAKEAPASWSAQDLVSFDYDGDIDNGLLEVVFKDIPTDFDFDGYVIKAVPGDDDPGNSDDLGVADHMSDGLIARPAVVGSAITQVLNLEPGTKYYVTVYAVNHNTVQISPNQRAQDSSSATTLLSAPFLGALNGKYVAFVVDTGDTDGDGSETDFVPPTDITAAAVCDPALVTGDTGFVENCMFAWAEVNLQDDDFKGAHFSLYTAEDEAGQHYFRWLNPAVYGPFDHVLDMDASPARDSGKQADMLSLDKDGDVEDHCDNDDIDDSCGHTHYQFKAVDDNGRTVASELKETNGRLLAGNAHYFQTVFTAESGDLTLSVTLGRMVGGKYKAMSDTASVMFEAPDDLRALDQTFPEYTRVLSDLISGVDKADEVKRYADSVFAQSDDGEDLETDKKVADSTDQLLKMRAYLNNQLN